MTEQTPIHAETREERAIPDRATIDSVNADSRTADGVQDGTESDLERYGLGPESGASDDGNELLSGADATQERDSALNRFGLGPEE